MKDDRKSNLALDGYDPVTLYETNSLKRGSFELRAKVDGLTYCFSNSENRGRFNRNPSQFLPQFSGHCAFACGLYGGLVPGNLEYRRNVSGKLYLFSGPRALWAWEKISSLIPAGHRNYDKKFRIRVK